MDLKQEIEVVIGMHGQSIRNQRCFCGWRPDTSKSVIDPYNVYRQHRAHQAEALAVFVHEKQRGAWAEGHVAGRDYQADGWNSDAHDPATDNPYGAQA